MKNFMLLSLILLLSGNLYAAKGSKPNVYAAFNLTGWGPNQGLGSGGYLGFFLTESSALEFEYLTATAIRASWGDEFSIKQSNYGVALKYFPGNSFYNRIGVGKKKVNYKVESVNSSTQVHTTLGEFEGDATYGIFAIGNQWFIGNFTIGCDWIGVSHVFSHNVTENIPAGTSESDRNSISRDEGQYLKNTVVVALRFYLGFSF